MCHFLYDRDGLREFVPEREGDQTPEGSETPIADEPATDREEERTPSVPTADD